jgi:hypothetical protein
MSLDMLEVLHSAPLELTETLEGTETVFRVSSSGSFDITRPGRFDHYIDASVTLFWHDPPDPNNPAVDPKPAATGCRFRRY